MILRDTSIVIGSTVFILAFGALSSLAARVSSDRPQESFGSWSCVADTRVCSDGSTVNRVPPYCQFAACP